MERMPLGDLRERLARLVDRRIRAGQAVSFESLSREIARLLGRSISGMTLRRIVQGKSRALSEEHADTLAQFLNQDEGISPKEVPAWTTDVPRGHPAAGIIRRLVAAAHRDPTAGHSPYWTWLRRIIDPLPLPPPTQTKRGSRRGSS